MSQQLQINYYGQADIPEKSSVHMKSPYTAVGWKSAPPIRFCHYTPNIRINCDKVLEFYWNRSTIFDIICTRILEIIFFCKYALKLYGICEAVPYLEYCLDILIVFGMNPKFLPQRGYMVGYSRCS